MAPPPPPSLSPQALLQLPYLDTLYRYSLKLLRYADTTTLASLVRADWTFYSSHPALFLSTYLAHGLLVDYFEKKRRCGVRGREDSTTNLEWLASLWDWYASYLFHPIASLQQVPSNQSDWEDDPSFFFEHLAFPDLWLRPLVNVDYIKALPTWRFRSVGRRRGSGSGEERHSGSESSQSDRENSPCAGFHTCAPDRMYQQGSACSQDHSSPTCGAQPDCLDPDNSHKCVCGPAPEDTSCDWSSWPRGVLHCSECVVCLENFMSQELLMGLPCGHAFHQQCIVVWLAAGRHCCPVCRWPSYKKKKQQQD